MTLSASAIARGLACPASLVLHQQDYRTEYADAGTSRHENQEQSIERGDLSSLPEQLVLPGDVFGTEISYAYDPVNDTARVLGRKIGRNYSAYNLGPFDVPGTLDLEIVGSGRIVVIDYKSFEEVDEAYDNDQIATYALMVSRAHGYDEVTVAIVYLVANRRPSIATLTSSDLVFHRDRLRQLHVDVAAARRDPTPYYGVGKQCKYCPAFLSCPQQKQLTTKVDELAFGEAFSLAVDEDARAVYELWGRVKMLSARLGAALHARASERPIPLSNGKVFGPRPTKGNDELDADTVYEVVRAKYGQAIADTAVERTATKTRLKEALGFVAPRGKVAAAEREVLAMIRERGGITNKPGTKIEEHTPQPLLRVVKESA